MTNYSQDTTKKKKKKTCPTIFEGANSAIGI